MRATIHPLNNMCSSLLLHVLNAAIIGVMVSEPAEPFKELLKLLQNPLCLHTLRMDSEQ